MNFKELFFGKKKVDVNKPIDDEGSLFKIVDYYDLKPYIDLQYDLIYAHDECLIQDDNIIVCVRRYRDCLIKIALVDNFNEFKNYDLSKENLKNIASKKEKLQFIEMQAFDASKEVLIVIFKEKSEEIKKFCFLNTKADKNYVHSYMIYNHKQGQILNYRKIKDFSTPYKEYNTALYFDLACVDKENY